MFTIEEKFYRKKKGKLLYFAISYFRKLQVTFYQKTFYMKKIIFGFQIFRFRVLDKYKTVKKCDVIIDITEH